MLDKMLADKESKLPEEGFNLVVLDDFEPPGEQLTVASNHATEEEAAKAKSEFEKDNPGAKVFVYGPDS